MPKTSKTPTKRMYLDVERGLVDQLDTKIKVAGVSRRRYVEELIRKDLGKEDDAPARTAGDLAAGKERERKMDLLFDEALIGVLSEDPSGLMEALDKKTLAQIIASRAPKPIREDEGLKENLVSLSEALRHLPDVEDLSFELNLAKGKLSAVEKQLQLTQAQLKAATKVVKRSFPGFAEQWETMLRDFEKAVYANVREGEVRAIELPKLSVDGLK